MFLKLGEGLNPLATWKQGPNQMLLFIRTLIKNDNGVSEHTWPSPVQLLTSAYKVLRPGGVFVASFSNRMFHTKAVRMWLHLNCEQRRKVVAAYLHYAGFDEIKSYELPPLPESGGQDPLNIVVGYKRNDTNKDEL